MNIQFVGQARQREVGFWEDAELPRSIASSNAAPVANAAARSGVTSNDLPPGSGRVTATPFSRTYWSASSAALTRSMAFASLPMSPSLEAKMSVKPISYPPSDCVHGREDALWFMIVVARQSCDCDPGHRRPDYTHDRPPGRPVHIAHLEAALPLAERLNDMAREWYDDARDARGRVLPGDPRERPAALAEIGDRVGWMTSVVGKPRSSTLANGMPRESR